jgi:hypothetical protein
LGDLKKARQLLASGARREEVEATYPGWEKAEAELQESLAALSKATTAGPLGAAQELGNLGQQRWLEGVFAAVRSQDALTNAVIQNATATTSSMAMLKGRLAREPEVPFVPSKTGEEYALERIERRMADLVDVTSATAENTKSIAELTRATGEQILALGSGVDTLRTVTANGMRPTERLTRVLVVLAALTVIAPLRDLWSAAEPWRDVVWHSIQGLAVH